MGDSAFKNLLFKRGITGLHRQAHGQLGQIAFGYLEIHFKVPQVVQGRYRVTRLQVGPGVHLPQPQHTGKRRPDGMVVKIGASHIAAGLGRFQGGTERIDFRLGDGTPLHQLLTSAVIGPGPLVLRLGPGQFGTGVAVIQSHQQLAPGNLLPLLEMDLRYPARHFRQQHHGLGRPGGAHGFHPIVKGALNARRQVHHGWRAGSHGRLLSRPQPPSPHSHQCNQHQSRDNPRHAILRYSDSSQV